MGGNGDIMLPPQNVTSGLSSTTASVRNVTVLPTDDINNYMEERVAQYIHLIYVPICVSLGVIGNIISFCVLVMTSLRKTTTCLYLATIACMDSLILVIDLVFYLRRYYTYSHTDETCGILYFIFYTTIHYDVLLLLSMTAERYVAVSFPLHAHSLITLKKAVIVIVTLAFFSLGVNLHNLFTRSADFDSSKQTTFCGYDGETNKFFVTKVFPWIDSALYCFIPMTSLFVLNFLIIANLKRAAKKQQNLTHTLKGTAGNRPGQSQRQLTVMLMLVSFAFLFLSAPVAIIIIVQRYAWFPKTPHEVAVFHLVHAIIDNLMYTNHTINFLLYCISGQKFRTELRRLCCSRRRSRRSNTHSSDKIMTLTNGNTDVALASVASTVSTAETDVFDKSNECERPRCF
ncbi:growth hormone secretagogue receptor type 1-like [Haliotis rufescens]|uniref:growth hormone secretagogue receptor type 1-like n=1 Tax=Haliotis rufescens TaxID=6454 RepID=UPI00201EBBB6|nr:growth hormone secretagogue receptor type 1-like [Haliotis rufescens]